MKEKRTLKIDFLGLEGAFQMLSNPDRIFGDFDRAYLDLRSGEMVHPETEDDNEALFGDENLLAVPDDFFDSRFGFETMESFVESLEQGPLRQELARAISSGKGAFRRFKDIIFNRGVEVKRHWYWFETRRQRERIVEWLRKKGIEPMWDDEIFPPRR